MFNFLNNKYDSDIEIDNKPSAINKNLSDKQFIELEIMRWKKSKQRENMVIGERYYNNDHDILRRKRTVIGKDGELQEVKNLPNNKIIDNQYAKMVLATVENNHYESGENRQKKSKRKSHYYNNSKGSTIVLANNAQIIGANE